jgi:diguanylate cyclase (GGDEF)-like protein
MDFQLRDAEVLELLARTAAQIIRASFDAVTGMLTSAAFIAQATARLTGQSGRASAHGLIYIDIDQLNVVNENHGMHVGDEVIQSVAALVSRRGREGALVSRIGGDRFAMFVPGCGIEPAARIAEELRGAAIRLSGARGDKPLQVSLSIGVARIGERDRRLDHALAAAELACRVAKERGRNRVEIFYGNAQSLGQRPVSSSFAAEVTAALAADSFELLAQPILPLSAAPAEPRFEILLRVRAGDGSRLGLEKLKGSPGCEELARSIDQWVIEQATQRLAGCRDLLRRHPARFSINLSAASLGDGEFWRMLEERVRKSRIDPGVLSFEFPEEAAAGHNEMIAPFMCRLREQGVSFALDNFGRAIGLSLGLGARRAGRQQPSQHRRGASVAGRAHLAEVLERVEARLRQSRRRSPAVAGGDPRHGVLAWIRTPRTSTSMNTMRSKSAARVNTRASASRCRWRTTKSSSLRRSRVRRRPRRAFAPATSSPASTGCR